jgi:hypothetical protein
MLNRLYFSGRESNCLESFSVLDAADSALLSFYVVDCFTQVVPKPKVIHPTLLSLRKWEDKQAAIPENEFGLVAKDLVVDDDTLRDDIVYPNVPHFPRTHLQGF